MLLVKCEKCQGSGDSVLGLIPGVRTIPENRSVNV